MNGRLFRSRRERVLGGVAGGLAEYLDLDPSLVRIVWAILVFTTGGLFGLIYLIMWVVIPEAPPGYERARLAADADDETIAAAEQSPQPRPGVGRRRSGDGRLILGAILVVLGLFFLVRTYLPAIAWDRFWPILLVVAGVALLVASLGRRR